MIETENYKYCAILKQFFFETYSLYDFRMAHAFAKDIFIVGAKRTAFGTFGGSLKVK